MALIGSAVYQFDKFREVTQTLNLYDSAYKPCE